MKKTTIGILAVGLWMMDGCGGSSDNSSGSIIGGSGSNIPDINLTQAINDGDVVLSGTIQDRYLQVINYLRDQNITCADSAGVSGPSPHLIWNADLAASAQEHSEDMLATGHYDHTGSGTGTDITAQAQSLGRGSKPSERMQYNGYTGNLTAENIAHYQITGGTPSNDVWLQAMEGWIKSTQGHCSNIMDPRLTDFGMYESRATSPDSNGTYHVYWTQNFGGNVGN